MVEELKAAVLAVENDEDAATVYDLFRPELTEETLIEINDTLVPEFKKNAFISWYKKQPGCLIRTDGGEKV